ncbi:hypothetical protein HDV01_005792 [Terramyces sp. JEL0728]|nr:hypothetical protein HDV01_005792 [Terramyces sp. JEL0728]
MEASKEDPWGNHSEIYDTAYTDMTTKYSTDVMHELERHGIRSALDVGCGTGAFALLAAAKYSTTAIDISPGMVKKTIEKAVKLNLSLNCFVCDAQTLAGIKDSSLDAAVSVFALFLAPDKAAALNAAYRVLSTGGLLAVIAFNADPTLNNQVVEMATFIQYYMGKDPSEYPDPADTKKNPLMFEDSLTEYAQDAGFQNIKIITKNHDLKFPTGRDAIGFYTNSPIMADRIRELGKETAISFLVEKFGEMGFKRKFFDSPVILSTHSLMLFANKP